MAALLNLHSDCCIAYESHAPMDLMRAFLPTPGCLDDPGQFSVETTWGGLAPYHAPWGLHQLTNRARALGVPEPQVALVRAALRGIREHVFGSPQVFGSKSPLYATEAGWRTAKEVLPEARFLVMERDVEECIRSIGRQKHWGIGEAAAREWIKSHQEGLETIPDAFRVQLSDLCKWPEANIRAVLDWLGLSSGAAFDWALALHTVNGKRVN